MILARDCFAGYRGAAEDLASAFTEISLLPIYVTAWKVKFNHVTCLCSTRQNKNLKEGKPASLRTPISNRPSSERADISKLLVYSSRNSNFVGPFKQTHIYKKKKCPQKDIWSQVSQPAPEEGRLVVGNAMGKVGTKNKEK